MEASHDTTRATVLANWGEFLYRTKPDSAIILFQLSLEIAEVNSGKSTDSIINNGFVNIRASMYNNLAYMFEQQGHIDWALDYNDKSWRLYDSIGNEQGEANSLNNIGFIFSNQGETEQAKQYYRESIDIRRRIKDSAGLAQTLNNLGLIYRKQSQIDSALTYYRESLKIRRLLGLSGAVANSLGNLAYVWLASNNFEKALVNFRESLTLHQQDGNVSSVSTTLCNIGETFKQMGNLDSAMTYALAADVIANRLGYPRLLSSSSTLLYELYRDEGSFEQALAAHEVSVLMRDSLYNLQTQSATIKLELQHEYEKAELLKDIERENEAAIGEEQQKSLEQIIWAISLGSLLILGVLGLVYSRMRVIRKQKAVIEQQKKIVEIKNNEITDSIAYAKRIQQAILPTLKELQLLPEHFLFYQPKDIVSGDFYWLESFATASDSEGVKTGVLFAAADCTGHGVPGAMVSVVCANALTRAVKEHDLISPGEILDKSREEVIAHFGRADEDIKDGMDIALCSIHQNGKEITLNYAGANNPLWIIRDGELITYAPNKQPIGKFRNQEPFKTTEIFLRSGDTIYLFSDGFVDQFGGPSGKKYKSGQFKKFLTSIQDRNMVDQLEELKREFTSWKGELEQLDDVCIIGVRL
ncbi:MAG: tetratricopeptide repeat protein, partial [Flavobacteriales bacterium]|nr:tetratricopeptide repeat protein [Flavobacteriales bacterium]